MLLPLLVTMCWSLFGLASTAPAKRASSPFPFNVTQALARASETWQRPCGSNLQSTNAEVDSSFNRTASYVSPSGQPTARHTGTNIPLSFRFAQINIQIQVNMTLLDLENWRYRSGTNSSATTWNDSLRKRQFKFLQPFVVSGNRLDLAAFQGCRMMCVHQSIFRSAHKGRKLFRAFFLTSLVPAPGEFAPAAGGR